MKKSLLALCLTCVLLTIANGFGNFDKKKLNAPIPKTAQNLVAKSLHLAERDQFEEAIAALRQAIALAPNYVNAHAEYIQIKSNFMWQYDEARKEYESLMKKEPGNPVYPMALAIAQYQTSESSKNNWLKKVIEIAPDWSWSHYARALLISGKEPETAVAELKKYIEADGSWISAYYTLAWIEEKTLKRLDDALATREKAASRPDARSWNFVSFWELRLGKAGGSEEAKAALRKELEHLSATSREIQILDAVRQAYQNLLNDKEKSKAVEAKIRQIDPAWYPERGRILYMATRNTSGAPRLVVAVNHQFAIWNKTGEFSGEMEKGEKIAGLEKLFSLKPNAEMKRHLYEEIFKIAGKEGNVAALVKYGNLLYAIDSTDAAIPAKISITLASNKKDAQTALRYARTAERATAVFRPVPVPLNNGATLEEWNKERFTEDRQQNYYKNLRALALNALGWALCQTGQCAEAEIHLKKSIELSRSEQNLSHYARVLEKLGRSAEAEKITEEAKVVYAESLKRTFKNEPAKDFELTTIEGQKIKLSDLKGKVVMIDFWATWCGPCKRSAPTLNKIYEKYKKQGLEILYISVDEQADLYKVAPFAREYKLKFPVLLDEGAREMYNVKVYPTTIFIDREGKVRYRDTGFTDESPRLLETVVELLLQNQS
jgi:thiol-disulfide isomerase/thioredoxin